MAVNFEDTVFGFDLNYLHQTTDYNLIQSRIDKQRTAILKAKKKTICTDSLIRKYHEKQQLLEEMEKDFLASQEECKNICIDYKNSLEKCSKLEMETKNLQTINQELEKKLRMAENQQEGSQAHSIQLQNLIKEYETRIEALKIEIQLEKNNTRENDKKKIVGVTKDNSEFMKKHIHLILDVALKNNNLSSKDKMLLNKYKKLYKCNESCKEVESSDDETDTFETYECNENTIFTTANAHAPSGKPLLKIDDIDRDSNGSNNEIVSIDTGRGSSLAFSDSDKCFHSPEYFSDNSPLSVETLNNKDKKTFANKATSPINIRTNNAALSPVKELQILDTYQKPIKGVIRNEISESLMQFSHEKNGERENFDSNRDCYLSGDENSNDCEIETILSSMRFNQNLITPIPVTPSKSRLRMISISEHSEHTCPEAAKVREENKTLQTSVANLAKEVMSIKSMLRLQLMTGGSDTSKSKVIWDNKPCTQKGHENERASLVIANEKSIFDSHSDNDSQCSIDSLATLVNEFPPAEDDESIIINQSTENNEETNESCSVMEIDDTVPMNASCNLLFEEDPEIKEVSDNLNNGNNLNIVQNIFGTLPRVSKKNMGKLTKLQRLRVKMLPKGKIPIARTLSQRKLQIKPKQIKIRKKKPSKTDSSATLNDKEVYQKAVKVMTELKSKNVEKESIKKVNSDSACDVDVNSNQKYSNKSNTNVMESDSSKEHNNLEFDNRSSQAPIINTRSRRKHVATEDDDENSIKISNKNVTLKNITTQETREKRKCLRSSFSEREIENKGNSIHETAKNSTLKNCVTHEIQEKRKSLKRPSLDEPEPENKRVLRSSSAHLVKCNNSFNLVNDNKQWEITDCKEGHSKGSHELHVSNLIADYSDLDIFTDEPSLQSSDKTHDRQETQDSKAESPQESVLCAMLEKYGVAAVKKYNKKTSESIINSTCKQIQDGVAKIIDLPQNETKSAMNSLVESLRKCHIKQLLIGLMHYLKDPARKAELFSKISAPSVPSMTKSEQVLLYILTNLQGTWPGVDFIGCVLDNMEYILFKLNCTPEFGTIESMSHFYAVLCRYIKNKSRLRLFILDAMYCIQYKAVPLIKQCMEVWMHILPLAHLGIAKSPLVMCVVYLLHFFKCEDRFNRVMEIRNILSQKYFYKFSDWNESKILEMFRSSIKEIKGDTHEKKMLRLALIVLAKRQGPQWCQNNIIKNLLLPIIEDEKSPEKVKTFCLSMVGPLLKPYPGEMKVHCEIVMNQLIDLINSTSSPHEQEAIVTSLIYMSKHNPSRVASVLLSWSPKQVSSEMEAILKGYVREKPLKIWKQQLSRLH